MAEEHAIQIYSLLAKGLSDSNKRAGTEAHLERAAANLPPRPDRLSHFAHHLHTKL